MSMLEHIRERAPRLRDRAPLAKPPAVDVRTAWRQFGRPVSLAAVFAAFVGASGAFGTERISPDVRFPMLELAAVVIVLGDVGVGAALDRADWLSQRRRLKFGLRTVLGLTWATVFCWGLARLFEGPPGAPAIISFVPPILVGYAAAGAIRLLLLVPAALRPGPRPDHPAFMGRLPHRLRNTAIIAVQGEDHYIRVHTSRGQHLLLMRLSDALTELGGLDGGQTHRSWWVARSAVTGVRRGNGRAALTLSNGVEAPVSRRFSPWLRTNGWY